MNTANSPHPRRAAARQRRIKLPIISLEGLSGLALIAAMGAAALPNKATAAPLMQIPSPYPQRFVNDYDLSHPGDESLFVYRINNESSAGDINNMINATITAGSNQGVYKVLFEDGFNDWTHSINPTNTLMDSAGSTPLIPGDYGTIKLYSHELGISTGHATAIATGSGMNPNVPFEDYNNPGHQYVPVSVPTATVPEPSAALGGAALLMGLLAARMRKRVGSH